MNTRGHALRPPTEQRRPVLAQDDTWIRGHLTSAPVAQIVTMHGGRPFPTPTLFWFDPDERRLCFHSNVVGRLRANADLDPAASFSTFRVGCPLPSNVALEFSVQYESVVGFGQVEVLADPGEQRKALGHLIEKYFHGMRAGVDFRPPTDQELRRTSVYALQVEEWSGKRNWADHADQSPEWSLLDPHWFSAFPPLGR